MGYLSKSIPLVGAELNLCVMDEANQTLSEGQKELLCWHSKLGHVNFAAVQQLLRSGALGASPLKTSAGSCHHPRCASCQFGKARRRPAPGDTRQQVNKQREGALCQNDLQPGQRISVDHYVCSSKGRLYSSMGKTHPDKMYSGGAIFVDHASGYIYCHHQTSMTTHETLAAKHTFERHLTDMGVTALSYSSDNGPAFSSKEYTEHLETFGQTARYAGVGAHHQNGIAEQSIGSIMSMARTMMLHAAIRWPDASDATLWPMAVDYACYIYNHAPNPTTGIAPIDVMTRTQWPRHKLQGLHVWGSPTYVLDPRLQDGKKIPKWNPRSRQAVFLGFSTEHASTIPLVLNRTTNNISPQYHVVFDDWFSTVPSEGEVNPDDWTPPFWADLFNGSRFQIVFDENDDPYTLQDDYLDPAEVAHRQHQDRVQASNDACQQHQNQVRQPDQHILPPLPPGGQPPPPPAPQNPQIQLPTVQREIPTIQLAPLPQREIPPHVPRRSTRVRKAPERLLDQQLNYLNVVCALYSVPLDHVLGTPDKQPFSAHDAAYRIAVSTHPMSLDIEVANPMTFLQDASHLSQLNIASKCDPDTLMYHEAMAAHDREQFLEAMELEITQLTERATWTIVPRNQALNRGKRVLPGTWTFRRKRYPDGRIKKYKARFCVRGDLEIEGVDYLKSETYAPVVAWSTVRMMMIFALTYDLHTQVVDYTNAFAQAELNKEVYIEKPKGYVDTGSTESVLKLNKALYGQTIAPRTWYDKLCKGLMDRQFTPSTLDPCLFLHKDMMVAIFVDDTIFIAKDKSKITTMINSLKTEFELTDEGDLATYLGVQIDRNTDTNTFTLTQTGLINRTLEATGMTDCNTVWCPAQKTPLGADKDGPPFNENWNYASVVGMLLYLASNSRPDISYAVHQCARFTHNPRQSHATGIKTILRYLQGTKTQGLIVKPSKDLSVDCYCDADFAGQWGVEDDQDPVSVKSRTGFVILLANCPLMWCSKLQTEIALSTTESEYVALSQSMRSLIPIRQILEEMATCEAFDFVNDFNTRTFSKCFEDNNGALLTATSPRMTPRTKHIAVKMHFFKDHVARGDIKIVKVSTDDQMADIFTKGLCPEIFCRIRALLMGW